MIPTCFIKEQRKFFYEFSVYFISIFLNISLASDVSLNIYFPNHNQNICAMLVSTFFKYPFFIRDIVFWRDRVFTFPVGVTCFCFFFTSEIYWADLFLNLGFFFIDILVCLFMSNASITYRRFLQCMLYRIKNDTKT